jgi:hypothetical protein
MTERGLLKQKQADQAAGYFKTLVRQMVQDRIDPWVDRQVAAFMETEALQADVAANPYQAARDLAESLTGNLDDVCRRNR